MSFVAGFVTGVTAGEAAERSKGRKNFLEYMQSQGFKIIDRIGREVPLEKLMQMAHQAQKKSWRTILFASVTIAAVAAVTGGTAWLLLSAI